MHNPRAIQCLCLLRPSSPRGSSIAARLQTWSLPKTGRWLQSSTSSPQQQQQHKEHQPQQQQSPKSADTAEIPEVALSTSAAYKQFGRPFAKVFLGAIFTYQVLYWCWEKLRIEEIREEKLAELKALESQVEEYKQKKGVLVVVKGLN